MKSKEEIEAKLSDLKKELNEIYSESNKEANWKNYSKIRILVDEMTEKRAKISILNWVLNLK